MIRNFGLIAGAVLLLNSCSSHFISDRSYREKVASDLALRESVLEAASVDFDAMSLSTKEREALEFLYAYMPLGDIVNREPSFYLDQYRMTCKAMEEMRAEVDTKARAEESARIVFNMLDKKLTPEVIADLTGISLTIVQELERKRNSTDLPN